MRRRYLNVQPRVVAAAGATRGATGRASGAMAREQVIARRETLEVMKALVPAAILLLAGCAHGHLQVQDMGNGQHSLTATAPSGGFSGSHEEAVERANEFCARTGQQPGIDGFYDKPELGPLGEHTSSIIFRCVAPRTLHF
jgi:hypothetical protein